MPYNKGIGMHKGNQMLRMILKHHTWKEVLKENILEWIGSI